MLDSATCRGYTDDITGRRKTYAPHREKTAQLQRHKAHCHRRDDRRPHRVGGVSGVSEGISPPAHASHRAHHLPDHVLLHRRGVSLHAEHPQVYRAALCFRADLAFLLHIFLARFHRLALLYSVLLRRRAQPDERYKDEVKNGKGYDHNWVLNTKGDVTRPCATLESPSTGIVLDVYTNEPGIQIYAGNFLDGTLTGKKGIVYGHRASVCLETQKYPDTPNKPEWPSALLKPGEKYDSHCIYRFSVKK